MSFSSELKHQIWCCARKSFERSNMIVRGKVRPLQMDQSSHVVFGLWLICLQCTTSMFQSATFSQVYLLYSALWGCLHVYKVVYHLFSQLPHLDLLKTIWILISPFPTNRFSKVIPSIPPDLWNSSHLYNFSAFFQIMGQIPTFSRV